MKIFFDPSFRNWGWVYWENGIVDAGVITTKPAKGFMSDLEACVYLSENIKKLLAVEHDQVISESPTGSQNQRAAIGIGIVTCLLSNIPKLKTVTPMFIKKKFGFKEKSDSLALFTKQFPNFPWIKGKWKDKTKTLLYSEKNSHIADALAAGLSVL